MTQTVEIPLWLLLLIIAFAVVTLSSHFLFPSVRWYLRRRMERVVERLNTRLQRPIEPFKLARRYDMIQRLIYDPEVSKAVAEHAKAEGIPENVAFEQASRYAREIVPGFSASAYFGIAIRLARFISKSIYRVRIGVLDDVNLNAVSKDATVVFVMNHRSNMDYVLVTWLVAERSPLSYAVGEWARVWPLSALIKSMGAYFIRRKSRGDLYRRVLARYVYLATEAGVTQAMFPEGGLSLTGALAAPKLGLLKYLAEGRSNDDRDVVFVPVAINYDRVMEDRVLVAAAQTKERRFPTRIRSIVAFGASQLWLRITGRYRRHGYALVSFGSPVSYAQFRTAQPKADLQDLADHLMQEIGHVVPVLPVPMMARILLRLKKPMSRAALLTKFQAEVAKIPDAHVHAPQKGDAYTVNFALEHLLRRGFVTETTDGVVINTDERPLLEFYAASIKHLF